MFKKDNIKIKTKIIKGEINNNKRRKKTVIRIKGEKMVTEFNFTIQ